MCPKALEMGWDEHPWPAPLAAEGREPGEARNLLPDRRSGLERRLRSPGSAGCPGMSRPARPAPGSGRNRAPGDWGGCKGKSVYDRWKLTKRAESHSGSHSNMKYAICNLRLE